MSLAGDLKKISEEFNGTAAELLQGVCVSMSTSVIDMTPVGNSDLWKTKYKPKNYVGGRLRGNWQAEIGSPAAGELDAIDAGGEKTKGNAARKAAKMGIGDIFFLTNNMPYALVVEKGSSTQAPKGMVGVTLTRFQRIVKKEANRINK